MTATDHRAGRAPALAGAAAVGLCLVTLIATGRTLPFPADIDPSGLVRWSRTVGTTTAAFTALRALALVLFGWWALTWVAGVVARRTRRRHVVAVVDRLSPRFIRHLAEAAVGVGVVVAGLSPAMGAGATAPAPAVAMVDLGPAMTDLGPVEPAAPPSAAPVPSARPSVDEPSTASTWTVEPGDTLWHVAEATASDALGRPADAAETARRLDELVALNADRLAVPGDPSLVFPGQEFLLR